MRTSAPTKGADHVGRGLLDALSVMRAPRSRPRPASLGPLGQFTFSRATKYAARPAKKYATYLHPFQHFPSNV